MADLGVKTVSDLRALPIERLRREFGEKLGDTYFHYARGIDNRGVMDDSEPKSCVSSPSFDNGLAQLWGNAEFFSLLYRSLACTSTSEAVHLLICTRYWRYTLEEDALS